jgi:glycosyltransferase involved in cell wall biosynthesis
VRIPAVDDGPLVFLHSSDELYGADRILLDIHAALPESWRARAEFWLPTDVTHGSTPLCVELEAQGAVVRHVDLPVLRRAYRSPRALAALADRARRLRRDLRQLRPALVYCTTSATFLGAVAARSAGTPRVVGHVQELWSGSDTRILGALARCCHQLLAISQPVLDGLPEGLRDRATVVLNATAAPARYVPLTEHRGPLRFVVASRWNGWKGHRTLLAAWDRLEQPGHLVVLGGPPPSGESVDVPALVNDLRFPDTVEVVGEVADVDAHLETADVVVVPSDNPEPFGLVAVEAFARGRPVVGSAAGGLADTITDGTDGWLYPLRDATALSEVLARLTRESVTEAGAAARASYERRFTRDRFAEDWRSAVRLDAGWRPRRALRHG